MHLWTLSRWEKHYSYSSQKHRRGLYIRFDKNVDDNVKRSCKEFCKWLRTNYYFPIRVMIYVKASEKIKSIDGSYVSATIFVPFNRYDEPYIRILSGDYEKLVKKRGIDNSIGAILHSIAHELTHYFQWINDIKLTEIGEERQAKSYARFILNEYAETRERP